MLGLGALCFGLGFLTGLPGGGPDLAESRSRIRDAVLSTDRLEQASLLMPVLERLNRDNVEELAEVFEATYIWGSGGFPLELFVASWAQLDPQGGRAGIAGWPADMRRLAWPALLGTWAHADPRAAFEVLDQIPDPAVRKGALGPVVEGWAASGAPGVWDVLLEISDPEQRRELTRLVVQRWISRAGEDALLRELEGLPETESAQQLEGVALASMAAAVARNDLLRGVGFAEARWEDDHGQEIARQVATHWASRDGPAAIAWLRARPAGEQRDLLLASAYLHWLQSDRPAAAAWIGAGALDPELAPIVTTHAAALAREDPELATEWAQALPPSEMRQRSLRAVGRVWRRSDPAAAARWLESVGLASEGKP